MILFLCFGRAIVLNGTKEGFNRFSLSDKDTLRINLEGNIAVFLNLVPGTFIADLRENLGKHRFIPVEVPAFSATGRVLRVRTTKHSSFIEYWLLRNETCPDPRNVGFLKADRVLHIETGINGTTCLFSGTEEILDGRTLEIETDYGFPDIDFYHPEAGGSPVRRCIGESDICEFKTKSPFMVVFKGDTYVRMRYEIASQGSGRTCSVQGIPQLRPKEFAPTTPKLTKIYNTLCAKTEDRTWDSIKGICWMAAFTLVVALWINGWSSRYIRKSRIRRRHK